MLIGLFVLTTGYAQTASQDIPTLLKPGKHVASVIRITPLARTARQTGLLVKVMQSMTQNAKWFSDTMPHVTDPNLYYQKLGLTKEELDEYLEAGAEPPVMIGTFALRDTLEVVGREHRFGFRGSGRLGVFDSLQIDVKRNVAMWGNQDIPYLTFRQMKDSTNPFKSPWSGHAYRFESDGKVADLKYPTDLANFNASMYSVMVGKLDNNGKIALLLLIMRLEKGKLVKNITLPCILD
jgi:hypothetical protein